MKKFIQALIVLSCLGINIYILKFLFSNINNISLNLLLKFVFDNYIIFIILFIFSSIATIIELRKRKVQ